MASIDQILEGIHKLPTVPSVVQELLASFDDEQADVDGIAAKVARDQVIAAKVLRMANSVQYHCSRSVSSIPDALMVIGFSNVRTLVIASGVTGMKFTIPGIDRKKYWQRGLGVAGVSRWLGGLGKLNGETCFSAGLLHGIGELLMRVADPGAYARVDAALAGGAKRDDAEQAEFATNHSEIGAELARRWRFPEEICQGILAHRKPFAYTPFNPVAGVVHIAEQILDGYNTAHQPGEVACEVSTEVLAKLGIAQPALFEQLPAVMADIGEWEKLLGD